MAIKIEHEWSGWSYGLPVGTPRELGILVKHGVEAYGFLIPALTTVTGEEFANLITEHYDDPRSKTIAAAMRTV